MLLSEMVKELKQSGFDVTGDWEKRSRKGIFLGDPKKYFPYQTAQNPQYPIDCTKSKDPNLSDKEVTIIRRRFKKRKN